jgi:hypothetical protein
LNSCHRVGCWSGVGLLSFGIDSLPRLPSPLADVVQLRFQKTSQNSWS